MIQSEVHQKGENAGTLMLESKNHADPKSTIMGMQRVHFRWLEVVGHGIMGFIFIFWRL